MLAQVSELLLLQVLKWDKNMNKYSFLFTVYRQATKQVHQKIPLEVSGWREMTSIAVEHSVCDGLGVSGTTCEVVATIGVTGLPVSVGMIGGVVVVR